ncbi:hypothetical protein HY442_01210 [Candidatus Parcubacteria bacterium]|nr:hypothetical protein [Candidatus Parcubacteria bacterium]
MRLPDHNRRSGAAGLVLIELIAALAILGFVTITATALFLATMQGQLQVRSDVAVVEGLRTTMETMTREIRASTSFQYNAALYGAQSLAFTRPLDGGATATVAYRLAADGTIERSGDGGAVWSKITSPLISVTALTFKPAPNSRVAISIKVRSTQSRLGQFYFSTVVAARNQSL